MSRRLARSRWRWVQRLTHHELHMMHWRCWRLWSEDRLSPGQAGIWDQIIVEAAARQSRVVRQDRCQEACCRLWEEVDQLVGVEGVGDVVAALYMGDRLDGIDAEQALYGVQQCFTFELEAPEGVDPATGEVVGGEGPEPF